jgi:hypothetical protein
MAHIARRDDWANLGQLVVGAVLFYHPAVWWLSRRLAIEREVACDDHVLAQAPPRDYALMLTEFAGQTGLRRWSAALAGWSNGSQLKERIHMILDAKRNSAPSMAYARAGLLVVGALALGLVALQAGPRLSFENAGTAGGGAESVIIAVEEPDVNVDPEIRVSEIAVVVDPVLKVPVHAAVIASANADSSGPRRKPAVTAVAPAAPDVPHAGTAIPQPPQPAAESMPRGARASGASGSLRSLEERLARLERMVERVMERPSEDRMDGVE